jgi:hypothetical protein
MRRLSFGEFKIRGSGQPFDHFALFVVEFGPRFQPTFFASRADGIK